MKGKCYPQFLSRFEILIPWLSLFNEEAPAPDPERHLTGFTSWYNSEHNWLTSNCVTTHNWSSLDVSAQGGIHRTHQVFFCWKTHYANTDNIQYTFVTLLKVKTVAKLASFSENEENILIFSTDTCADLNYKRALNNSCWHREGYIKQAVIVIKKRLWLWGYHMTIMTCPSYYFLIIQTAAKHWALKRQIRFTTCHFPLCQVKP